MTWQPQITKSDGRSIPWSGVCSVEVHTDTGITNGSGFLCQVNNGLVVATAAHVLGGNVTSARVYPSMSGGYFPYVAEVVAQNVFQSSAYSQLIAAGGESPPPEVDYGALVISSWTKKRAASADCWPELIYFPAQPSDQDLMGDVTSAGYRN